jgi:hypothetical protein
MGHYRWFKFQLSRQYECKILGTFETGGSTSLFDFMGSSWATYTPATPPREGRWADTWVDYDIAYTFVFFKMFALKFPQYSPS